jgi:hypothetical protein
MGSEIASAMARREVRILELARMDPSSPTYEALLQEILDIDQKMEQLRNEQNSLLTPNTTHFLLTPISSDTEPHPPMSDETILPISIVPSKRARGRVTRSSKLQNVLVADSIPLGVASTNITPVLADVVGDSIGNAMLIFPIPADTPCLIEAISTDYPTPRSFSPILLVPPRFRPSSALFSLQIYLQQFFVSLYLFTLTVFITRVSHLYDSSPKTTLLQYIASLLG